MSVPGFSDLVKRVLIENPASNRSIPGTVNEVWDSFSYWIFLSANRSEADARYLHRLFSTHGLIDRIEFQGLGYDWVRRVEEVGEAEFSQVYSQRKKGLLTTFLKSESRDEAYRCFNEGIRYFRVNFPSIQRFQNRTRDKQAINDLLAEIAYPKSQQHVYNFGLTKTILWLQGFGLALAHCSPSRQARMFLWEDIKRNSSLAPQVGWFDYWPWLKEVCEIADDMGVTARDINSAIWFYKTPQSLLTRFKRGLKGRFTPRTLLNYLDYKKWVLPEMSWRMVDIDQIDELALDITTFMEKIP